MSTLKTLLAVGLAGSWLAYPLASAARVDVDVEIAPPPLIVEDAPPRAGYFYTPGYWDWDAGQHRHVWKKGEYVAERRGEHWVPHKWEERDGRYHFNEGHWDHD